MIPPSKISPTNVPSPPPLGGGTGAGAAGGADVSLPPVLVSGELFPSDAGFASADLLSDPAGADPGAGSTIAVTSGSGTAIVWICCPFGRLRSTSLVVFFPPVAVTASFAAPLG